MMMRYVLLAASMLAFTFHNPALAQEGPPNDHCGDVVAQPLAIGDTLVFEGNNEGATIDGDNVPGSGLDDFQSAVVWEAFTTTECATVRIAFCGSEAPFLAAYYWNALTPDCPADNLVITMDYGTDECPDGQPSMYFEQLPPGTYYYPVYADENGPQGDYVLTVTATACPAVGPVADAGPDQHLCSTTTSTTMAANTPEPTETGTWTMVSGGFTIVDPTDPNTAFTELAIGENIAEWTVDDGTNANSDQVSIFLYDENNPAADAGSNLSSCGIATSIDMDASELIFPATGTWTILQGGATIIEPNNPNTEMIDWAVGENIFEWAVENGPCGASTAQLVVLVYDEEEPAADAGQDQALELPTTSATMAANEPTFPAQGTWSVVAGAGEFSDVHLFDATVTGLGVGENVFSWTVDNGPCGITEDEVTIQVSEAAVVIPAIAPGDTLILTGNNADAVDSVGLGVPAAWEAFELTECANVLVSYCNTDGFTVYSNALYGEQPGGATLQPDSVALCDNSAPMQFFNGMEPGIYWIAVLADPEHAMGDYAIEVVATECVQEPSADNNLCEEAELLVPEGAGPVYATSATVNLSEATGQAPAPACIDGEEEWYDRWYRLANDADDIIALGLTAAPDAQVGMEVFRACDGESVACAINSAPIQLTDHPAGEFIIRVFTYGTEPAQDDLQLLVAVDRTTGVQGANTTDLALFPNPGNGDFTLVAPFTATRATINVRDIAGRVVHTGQTTLTAGEVHRLNMSNLLRPGTYLVELFSEKQKAIARLVVN